MTDQTSNAGQPAVPVDKAAEPDMSSAGPTVPGAYLSEEDEEERRSRGWFGPQQKLPLGGDDKQED